MRKEVRAHNKYRDLAPWRGRETADITYVDSEGDLTKLLIEKGYLQSQTWEAERPTYYLEVKTTTKDLNEKFYMSRRQYNRVSLVNNPKISTTNQSMTDAEHAATATERSLRCICYFASFQPRGKNRPPSICRS